MFGSTADEVADERRNDDVRLIRNRRSIAFLYCCCKHAAAVRKARIRGQTDGV